jgi:glycosyltransferase involved in cell wall biosynthesis
MRILHVIQELRTGGAERVAVTLAHAARREGHEAAVAAGPGVLAEEIGGETFELPLVRRRPWRAGFAALALGRALRIWRPDLLHCHNPGMALVASLATLRGRTAPGLATFHGVPDEDYAAAARALRAAGFPVVACGPGVAQGLAEHGLSVAATIVNGITQPPSAIERSVLEAELGLPSGRRLLVVVGRLVPQKNQSLAIQALRNVPGSILVVLGEGPLRSELEREAQALEVDDRVRFAGSRPDARAIIGAADALVVSSNWEGLPLVALEALAAGTPIAASAVRGVRELLNDGENALLAPPGDAEALGAAISRLLTEAETADRLSNAGRALATAHTENAMVERYLELYERLVLGSGLPAHHADAEQNAERHESGQRSP